MEERRMAAFDLIVQGGTVATTSGIGKADIGIRDPEHQVALTNALMQHGVDYTPYEGMTLTGWPTTTISRGAIVCNNGIIQAPTGHGTFLQRGAYAPVAELTA
jgi:dihydropyrimidinase